VSNIEPGIIDPGKGKRPPDTVPEIDPDHDDLVEPDDIREPDADVPVIAPDPEEGRKDIPNIRRS